MLDIEQFRAEIVAPTLQWIDMHSPAAVELVVGTAVQESGLRYLRQLGGGPALGLYQIEPRTFDDVWYRYIDAWPSMRTRIAALRSPHIPDRQQLIGNLPFATAICRVRYWMDPEPLPAADDVDGLAETWKRIYNTPLGAGTAEEWAESYRRFALAA